MLHAVVRRLSRWMPRPDVDELRDDDWVDSKSSCHDSSYDLASGLDVIEHFGDTLPAFHTFPLALQGAR